MRFKEYLKESSEWHVLDLIKTMQRIIPEICKKGDRSKGEPEIGFTHGNNFHKYWFAFDISTIPSTKAMDYLDFFKKELVKFINPAMTRSVFEKGNFRTTYYVELNRPLSAEDTERFRDAMDDLRDDLK